MKCIRKWYCSGKFSGLEVLVLSNTQETFRFDCENLSLCFIAYIMNARNVCQIFRSIGRIKYIIR